MDINDLDKDYLDLVKNIINDARFLKLKSCEHHGISRYDHSLKVSYYAYKYAKKHGLDYKEVAVGGLLHDFFLDENYGLKQKFISTFTHPSKCLNNASDIFDINNKEKDIIKCHMFPLNLKVPRYKESWIVSLYDKKVAIGEFTCNFGYKLRYVGNLMLLLLFNFLK